MMRRSDLSTFDDWTIGQCIQFALDLEDNEERMGEGAAMALTCEQYGIEPHEGYEVLIALPDGNWWETPE